MYDDLTLRDFFHILYIIRDNKNQNLTHKQVRVYLDCMQELSTNLNIGNSYYLPSIRFHFHAMSCRLSHKKRSFLAEELLKLLLLLEQSNKEPKQQQPAAQDVEPESKQNLTQEEPDPDDIPFNQGDVSVSLETSPGNF